MNDLTRKVAQAICCPQGCTHPNHNWRDPASLPCNADLHKAQAEAAIKAVVMDLAVQHYRQAQDALLAAARGVAQPMESVND